MSPFFQRKLPHWLPKTTNQKKPQVRLYQFRRKVLIFNKVLCFSLTNVKKPPSEFNPEPAISTNETPLEKSFRMASDFPVIF